MSEIVRRLWATRGCCDVGYKMTFPSYKTKLQVFYENKT
jgi:hypothetical protein